MVLVLIEQLESTAGPGPVYVYPDGDSLHLSLQPSPPAPRYPAVTVEASPRYLGEGAYRIAAPAKPPWRSVFGLATDVETAVQMILEGLRSIPEQS